jgi:hypothetical protein
MPKNEKKKAPPSRVRLAVLVEHPVVVASAFEYAPLKHGRSYTSAWCCFANSNPNL